MLGAPPLARSALASEVARRSRQQQAPVRGARKLVTEQVTSRCAHTAALGALASVSWGLGVVRGWVKSRACHPAPEIWQQHCSRFAAGKGLINSPSASPAFGLSLRRAPIAYQRRALLTSGTGGKCIIQAFGGPIRCPQHHRCTSELMARTAASPMARTGRARKEDVAQDNEVSARPRPS